VPLSPIGMISYRPVRRCGYIGKVPRGGGKKWQALRLRSSAGWLLIRRSFLSSTGLPTFGMLRYTTALLLNPLPLISCAAVSGW